MESGDTFRLNLGTFDRCVLNVFDRSRGVGLDNCRIYAPDCTALYYDRNGGAIKHRHVETNFIPNLFSVGAATEIGGVDDQYAVFDVAASIQLFVFRMIEKLIEESRNFGTFSLNDITVVIGETRIFNNDVQGGCYGSADVGIVLVIPPERVNQQTKKQCWYGS